MNIVHGTCSAYERRGCRCALCTETHNARVRRNRADRLAAGRLTHGTVSAYDAGCRCYQCWQAKAAAYRRRKSRGAA